MGKVLFIIFFIAPALLFGYGVSAKTLEVFKKADKIEKLFKPKFCIRECIRCVGAW